MLTIYSYKKCSTCQKALKFLNSRKKSIKEVDITIQPPSKTTLESILNQGDYQLKDLFNKSGQLYREMKMKDRLPHMNVSEAIDLLSKNGKLIKRPIVTDGRHFSVGYKEDIFKSRWS